MQRQLQKQRIKREYAKARRVGAEAKTDRSRGNVGAIYAMGKLLFVTIVVVERFEQLFVGLLYTSFLDINNGLSLLGTLNMGVMNVDKYYDEIGRAHV